MTHRILLLVAIGLLACETLLAQAPATDSRQATLGPFVRDRADAVPDEPRWDESI